MPRWGKNFLTWRIRPIAQKLGIPDRLVTFQVMRRTLGTDLQSHGTLKDAQGLLRHASIQTTGNVYMQTIENERSERDELPDDGDPRGKGTSGSKSRCRASSMEGAPFQTTSGVVQQLDQVGPSFEGRVM